MSLRNILLVTAALVALAAPSTASACDWGIWGNYGLNYYRPPLRTGNLPTPPYFAIHPPVYYSGLQYRPYGDSPFAYYQSQPIAESMFMYRAAAAAPKIIENPHVQSEAATPAVGTTSQLIINPYYEPNEELADAKR